MLNGICRLLIQRGWIDQEVVARHTTKLDQLRAIVSRYTPNVVASPAVGARP